MCNNQLKSGPLSVMPVNMKDTIRIAGFTSSIGYSSPSRFPARPFKFSEGCYNRPAPARRYETQFPLSLRNSPRRCCSTPGHVSGSINRHIHPPGRGRLRDRTYVRTFLSTPLPSVFSFILAAILPVSSGLLQIGSQLATNTCAGVFPTRLRVVD